jgi:hypothetical protein
MLLPLACLKRYFIKVLQRLSELCDIIRVKRAASCCPGQNEDICQSIKKSVHYLDEGQFSMKLDFHFSMEMCAPLEFE